MKINPTDANLQRTALGWEQRALIAERNWRRCRAWAMILGAPPEKLGDDPETLWHEIRNADQASGAVPIPTSLMVAQVLVDFADKSADKMTTADFRAGFQRLATLARRIVEQAEDKPKEGTS